MFQRVFFSGRLHRYSGERPGVISANFRGVPGVFKGFQVSFRRGFEEVSKAFQDVSEVVPGEGFPGFQLYFKCFQVVREVFQGVSGVFKTA